MTHPWIAKIATPSGRTWYVGMYPGTTADACAVALMGCTAPGVPAPDPTEEEPELEPAADTPIEECQHMARFCQMMLTKLQAAVVVH